MEKEEYKELQLPFGNRGLRMTVLTILDLWQESHDLQEYEALLRPRFRSQRVLWAFGISL